MKDVLSCAEFPFINIVMPTYFFPLQFLYCKNQISGADSEFLTTDKSMQNLNVFPKYLQNFPFQCEF